MNTSIDVRQVVALGDAWKLAPEMVVEELTDATWRAEGLLLNAVAELTPVGVGGASGIKGSLQMQEPQVLSDTVLGMMGSALSYTESVEMGTKPHPVSDQGVAAIDDWVRYKLGIPAEEAQRVAEAVVWKIRMRGTPAVGMFHRGLAYSQAQLAGIFEDAAGRIVQRLAAGV